jgi:hypothetical protein
MLARFSLIVLAMMLIAMVAQAQDFVADGLVAMYTLDSADIDGDTVKDVSGNGNDATIMGALSSVEGVIGEALEFDGGANYVEIPALGDWEQASVECWALQINPVPSMQGIVSTWQWVAGKIHFKFQDGQIQVDKNDGDKITMNRELDTWYHIIYTDDTIAGELKLYVDGELVAQGVAQGTPENMNERRIGSEHDGRFLLGIVDEVRIYDRALELEEVEQNFEVTSNKLAVEPGGKLTTTWSAVKQDMLVR